MGYPVQNTCTRGIKLESVFRPAIRIALSSAEKIRCALGLYDFVATEGSARVLALFLGCTSRRAAGRPSGAACAKRGCIGQMQRPAELVPTPECLLSASLVPPWYLRKVRKNPESFLSKINKNLAKFWKICEIVGNFFELAKKMQNLMNN